MGFFKKERKIIFNKLFCTIFTVLALTTIGVGVTACSNKKTEKAVVENTDDSSFVNVIRPSLGKAEDVLIFAPVNCPSEVAQKAREIADYLDEKDIPHKIISNFQLNMNNPTKEEKEALEETMELLNSGGPAVFVRDRAKINPSLDEVVKEYEKE